MSFKDCILPTMFQLTVSKKWRQNTCKIIATNIEQRSCSRWFCVSHLSPWLQLSRKKTYGNKWKNRLFTYTICLCCYSTNSVKTLEKLQKGAEKWWRQSHHRRHHHSGMWVWSKMQIRSMWVGLWRSCNRSLPIKISRLNRLFASTAGLIQCAVCIIQPQFDMSSYPDESKVLKIFF